MPFKQKQQQVILRQFNCVNTNKSIRAVDILDAKLKFKFSQSSICCSSHAIVVSSSKHTLEKSSFVESKSPQPPSFCPLISLIPLKCLYIKF